MLLCGSRLIVSQMLTLYTTPVIYLYFDRFRLWRTLTKPAGSLGPRRERSHIPNAGRGSLAEEVAHDSSGRHRLRHHLSA